MTYPQDPQSPYGQQPSGPFQQPPGSYPQQPQQPSGPWQQPPAPYQQPYGQHPQQGYGYGPPTQPAGPDSGLAVGALCCSLGALVCMGLFGSGGVRSFAGAVVGLILSIVGVVLGHIARSKVKRGAGGGAGKALAAVIIGYVLIALVVIGIGVFVAFGIATHWRFR